MIVVLGASGKTGRAVGDRLRHGSERVRLVTRATALSERNDVEHVHANLSDARQLGRALAGARAVYALLPDDLAAAAFHAQRRTLVETLVSAIREQGIERVVAVSSGAAALGEHAASGFGRELALLERRLGESAKAVTILRPCYFQDNLAQALAPAVRDGVYLNFLPPAWALSTVAARDVGELAARALLEPARVGREIVDVVGPAYSPSEFAALLGECVGRRVSVVDVPAAEQETLFRQWMSPEAACAMRETFECLGSGRIPLRGDRREMGATQLADVLRDAREVTP